jgi:hypothetical protein
MPAGRVCAAACLCVLLSAVHASADEAPAGDVAVVPPGQEELLAELLGRGASFPGSCALTGGQADGSVVRATYRCPDGDVVVELHYPQRAPAGAVQTARFAVFVQSGAPPPGLVDALVSRIRSHEAAFEWKVLTPPPVAGQSSPTGPLTAVVLLTIAVFAWVGWWWWRAVGHAWIVRHARRWRVAVSGVVRDPVTPARRLLRDERFWVIVVLLGSALARGSLSIVNPQANDDHLIVAQMIHDGNWRPPASSACLECSHPKLYHYALALAFTLVSDWDARRIAGNLLNWAAGTALLVLFAVFARRARYSPPVRLLAVAFASFNAAVVGIFSQATNDGFCILFSSLAIFCLERFFDNGRLRHVVAATAFVILAAASKASGWMIFASGVAILGVTLAAAAPRDRRPYAVAMGVFVLGFLSIVSSMNPYADNIARARTPFVNDAYDEPMMKVDVARDPVMWVVDDLFTFRILELVRAPVVGFSPPPYPLHQESLWSQVYGRMFFLRFDQGIWENRDPRLLDLGRVCLVLGLLPLAALLVGTATLVAAVGRGVASDGVRWLAERRDWHHLVYIGVVLGALIALVIRYHRLAILFTWMKAIYLLPAVLPFFKLFLDGLEQLWRRRPRAVTAWMLAMVAASIVDLGWLIHDLTGGGSH